MTTTDGLLLVDKPGGLTSHDVVSRIRRLARTRRVGHAGTLDPMATGLLVLGIGRATRLLTYLVGADKTYTTTIRLGQSSTTDDADGEVTTSRGASLTREEVEEKVAPLRGDVLQVPSTVSAIKVDGQRAHARARAGEEVVLKARPVTIHAFEIHDVRTVTLADGMTVTDVDATIRCSTGTYIRALARDLGEALEVGGHLTALRRTHVADFDVTDALALPDREQDGPDLGPPAFLTLPQALARTFPVRVATASERTALSYGQRITPSAHEEVTAVLGEDGEALALVKNTDGQAKPVLVFAPA